MQLVNGAQFLKICPSFLSCNRLFALVAFYGPPVTAIVPLTGIYAPL